MERLKRNLSPESKAQRARQLDQRSRAERYLWIQLRKNSLGLRFRKQYRLGNYFLDFYCPQAKLCVEIDGEWHEERRGKDHFRDQHLTDNGIETMRYPADSIFLDPGGILYRIEQRCKERVEQGLGRNVQIKRQFDGGEDLA